MASFSFCKQAAVATSPCELSFEKTTEYSRQEPINMLGIVLGVGLALLILVLFGYTFVRWYQRGQCWRRPNFVFNLYHTCGLGSVAVELVPPFSISGSLSEAGRGYVPFHDRGL